MAAGKSTVAQQLAERLSRSVHLRGDVFRRMIVRGRAEMSADGSDEALDQLRLRYRLAADAAARYVDAGFTVVYQDVIVGLMLDEVIALHRAHPLHVIVLCPTREAVASREATRMKRGYGAFTIEELDRVLREQTPRLGLWIDSSELSVAQTIDAILTGLDRARIDVQHRP